MVMWFHELNPYRCAVLRKNFPEATVVEGDIKQLREADMPDGQCHFFAGIGGFGLACEWAGFDVPIWTGGFPCTDISVAGKGAGLDGKHSGLWFDWLRIIRARRPVRLLIENVPALRTRGYDRIHDALDEIGYAVRSIVVGAEAVGAPHRRNRVWIIAHVVNDYCLGFVGGNAPEQCCNSERLATSTSGPSKIPNAESNGRRAGSGEPSDESEAQCGRGESAGGAQLADASKRGLGTDGGARDAGHADQRDAMVLAQCEPCGSGNDQSKRGAQSGTVARWPMPPGPTQHEWEAPRLVEPSMGKSVDGLPRRVVGFARRNTLQALGDSIVPQVAAAILRAWKLST
jgi:DNA (cytosine-5)-methyltransferase 1